MNDSKSNQHFFMDRLTKVGKFLRTAGVEIIQGIQKNRIPTLKVCLPGILVAIALLLHWEETLFHVFGIKAHLSLSLRKAFVYFYALSGWFAWGISRAIQRKVILDRLKDLFESSNLRSNGRYPSLVSDEEVDTHVRRLTFKGNGVTASEFNLQKERIDSMLNVTVVKIGSNEKDKGLIEITYSTRDFPPEVYLQKGDHLPQGTIPIGLSHEGPLAVNLEQMGHLLVAGQTNGGKSNFLKVAASCLAANSPKAEIKFLDCKGGAEGSDLRTTLENLAGNIGYYDGTESSADELVRLSDQLGVRLDELKKEGVANIREYRAKRARQMWSSSPMREDKDIESVFIILDEATELMSKKSGPDGKTLKDASAALNRIARQGRAAGVHLIVAVQKPDSANFDQTVKANLPGVLCFPMGNAPSSIAALGTGRAFELDVKKKGRAIWKFGPKLEEVQTYKFN